MNGTERGAEKTPLLQMFNITKSFHAYSKTLNGVNFTLLSGEVHALMGENGAGKSTLIKILGGVHSMDSGEILINGRHVNIGSVADARRCGVAVINQELALVGSMTVAENIFLGREPMKRGFVDRRTMTDEAQKLLDEFGVAASASDRLDTLPVALWQMVEIIKAISLHSQILVMDEPTSSLTEKDAALLFQTVRTLTARGVGVIYISHKMEEIEAICDRVTILCDGRCTGTEKVGEVTRDRLISMMIGRDLTSYYPRSFPPRGAVALRCEHIADGGVVKDAGFEVRHGEIVGFSGLVGSGRTDLMKCLFGLTGGFTGDVFVNGERVEIRSPSDAMRLGIGFVPESRAREGLILRQNVRYNTTLKILNELIRGIRVDRKCEQTTTEEFTRKFATKYSSAEQPVSALSGGNQQKVMISAALAARPEILILDEPTRGIDVGAKAQIYAVMDELIREGIAIVMVSSELPEILNMSDRIYVMKQGHIAGELSRAEATQEAVMRLAAT